MVRPIPHKGPWDGALQLYTGDGRLQVVAMSTADRRFSAPLSSAPIVMPFSAHPGRSAAILVVAMGHSSRDLVNRARIELRDWTDTADHDPGVALLELFPFVSELLRTYSEVRAQHGAPRHRDEFEDVARSVLAWQP